MIVCSSQTCIPQRWGAHSLSSTGSFGHESSLLHQACSSLLCLPHAPDSKGSPLCPQCRAGRAGKGSWESRSTVSSEFTVLLSATLNFAGSLPLASASSPPNSSLSSPLPETPPQTRLLFCFCCIHASQVSSLPLLLTLVAPSLATPAYPDLAVNLAQSNWSDGYLNSSTTTPSVHRMPLPATRASTALQTQGELSPSLVLLKPFLQLGPLPAQGGWCLYWTKNLTGLWTYPMGTPDGWHSLQLWPQRAQSTSCQVSIRSAPAPAQQRLLPSSPASGVIQKETHLGEPGMQTLLCSQSPAPRSPAFLLKPWEGEGGKIRPLPDYWRSVDPPCPRSSSLPGATRPGEMDKPEMEPCAPGASLEG